MKRCTKCAVEKPLSEFKFIQKRKQYFPWCGGCSRIYWRQWRVDNPPKPHPVEPLVYRITNGVNGKIYIGITYLPFRLRKAAHISRSQNGSMLPVHSALRKYGIEKFTFEVIERVPDLASLGDAERRQIAQHNCMVPHGYNRTEGGDGPCGYRHTPESKAKRRATIARNGGYVVSEETKQKLRLANIGRKMSREAVERMRQKKIGKKRTAEQCANIAAGRAAGKKTIRSRTMGNTKYESGVLLKAITRVRSGERQTHVARDVGIDPTYLSQLLAGKRGVTLYRDIQ